MSGCSTSVEQVDERAPLGGVALAVVAQAVGGGGVDRASSSVVRVVVEDQGALADAEQVPTVGIGEVGLREHVVRRAAGHDPAGEQQQVVGGGGVAEVVGGHEHGVPGGPLGGDGVEDVLARHEVEAGDRLVEEQHLGLLGQALRHEGPLALRRRRAPAAAGWPGR